MRKKTLTVALIASWVFSAGSTASQPSQEVSEIRTIRVVAERFNFTPSQIRAREGERLRLILSSEDTFHGFRLPAARVDVKIPPRGRGEVEILITASAAGTYPFECSRPCGAGHTMMRGNVIVEGQGEENR